MFGSLVQAINLYSRANNIKPSDPLILGNRCTTHNRLVFCSHFLYLFLTFRVFHFEWHSSNYSESSMIVLDIILHNRISLYLRSWAASASEYRALNGLDPTMHAEVYSGIFSWFNILTVRISGVKNFPYEQLLNSLQLALKDADKVLSLRTNSIQSYILKAKALVLVRPFCLKFG